MLIFASIPECGGDVTFFPSAVFRSSCNIAFDNFDSCFMSKKWYYSNSNNANLGSMALLGLVEIMRTLTD